MTSHCVKCLDSLGILSEFRTSLVEHVGETFEEVVGELVGELAVGDDHIGNHVSVLEHVPREI